MTRITFPLKSSDEFVIYEEKPDYHLLLLNIPPDNRFTPETIPAILEAVTYIRTEGSPKPLITSSTSPKFFSNGLDFERAITTPGFFGEKYYPLMRVFLEFPWPTIALINGHAFAAGFMVASCHDYQVMNPDKGWLCMNELDFGAPLRAPMMGIFRIRYGVQLAHKITLTAHRFTSAEALKFGIITKQGGLPEAEEIVKDVAKYAQSPAYAQIRKELFRDLIVYLKTEKEENIREGEVAHYEEEFYSAIEQSYRSRM
ncbi:hypothetical protein EGM85_11350 [Macrococcus caseolyticus]|nr:hypothetical protein [Macrococcus caseolyticus]RKO11757.1 hypothetical protein D6861_11350 [Macrococcus caseolyticus]